MHWRRSGSLVGIFLLTAAMCNADTIAVDLMPPFLAGSPGSFITFSGTLSNTTGSTVFFNSAGINLSGGFTPADEDTVPFFMNAPLFLAANDLTQTIDLFTIHIPNPSAAGPYDGSFTVLGGIDENALDIVGSANFTLQVNTVPEPNTAILLGVALILLAYRGKRRHLEMTGKG